MSDPERLFKGRSDPEVTELVHSLRGMAPEAGSALGSWAGMAEKIAALPLAALPKTQAAPSAVNPPAPPAALVPPASVAPAAAPLAASASKLLLLKWVALALASAVAGIAFFRLGAAPQRRVESGSASVASASAFTPLSPVAPAPSPPPAASDSASPGVAALPAAPEKVSAALAAPSAPQIRSSALDAEASLLAKMRAELRGGEPRAALVTLTQLQGTFPRGALLQEREVLAVEVLAATGNLAAARRKASAFIAAHPTSPHSAKLERFVEAH